MVGTRALTSASLLAACSMYCALTVQTAHAEETSPADRLPSSTLHFDLPAQPLSDALSAYGHIAQRMVIAPSQYVEGRTSAPISGEYSPREALQRLLIGTGLQASFANADEAIV